MLPFNYVWHHYSRSLGLRLLRLVLYVIKMISVYFGHYFSYIFKVHNIHIIMHNYFIDGNAFFVL